MIERRAKHSCGGGGALGLARGGGGSSLTRAQCVFKGDMIEALDLRRVEAKRRVIVALMSKSDRAAQAGECTYLPRGVEQVGLC